MPLNDNQRRFIALYRSTTPRNAARAYEQVYSRRGEPARVAASRLLTNVNVRAEIDVLDATDLRELGVTAAHVLREMAMIGFADMHTYARWGPDGVQLMPVEVIDPAQRRVVVKLSQTVTQHGGTIRFELADKLGALKQLGLHLKLWSQEVDLGTDTLAALERVLAPFSRDQIRALASPNGTADLLPHQRV